jgi:hypothetical protein
MTEVHFALLVLALGYQPVNKKTCQAGGFRNEFRLQVAPPALQQRGALKMVLPIILHK